MRAGILGQWRSRTPPLDGQFWRERQSLTAPDGADDDGFGHAVALAHDSAGTLYILVGAPYDDDAGGATGSAYLFRQGEFEMEFVEKLSAPDQAQGHVFGHYVALTAGDDGVMYVALSALLSSMLGRLRMWVLPTCLRCKMGSLPNHKNSWRLMVPGTIGSGTRWGLLTVKEPSTPSRGRLARTAVHSLTAAQRIFLPIAGQAGPSKKLFSARRRRRRFVWTLSGFDRHRVRRGVRSDRCMA